MASLGSFCRQPDARWLGDILYLPQAPAEYEFLGAYESLMAVADRLPPDLKSELATASPVLARMFIMTAAREAADAGRSGHNFPTWFFALPPGYREEAWREWGLFALEDPQNIPSFPLTGLGGYAMDVDPNCLLGAAYQRFNLGRLGGIKQLAWLTQPVLPQEGWDIYPCRFEHCRLVHVYDTAALANLMAHFLELSSEDANTLILAAVTHDAATPAGGDTTKLLDRDAFNEETSYPELLDSFDSAAWLASLGVDRPKLERTVLGQGLLGELLDIADKTAYLARDAHLFNSRFRNFLHECAEGHAVHELLLRHPEDACAAWQSVVLRHGRPVFTDPEALARLLLLRALLFRALYFHPGSRFAEFVIGHYVLKQLYATGQVTRGELMSWRDEQLDLVLQEAVGIPNIGQIAGEPMHEGFDELTKAQARQRELMVSGEDCAMIETLPLKIKSGTDFLVCDSQSEPKPLREFAPELALPIDALARVVHPYRLYWVRKESMPRTIIRLLQNL